MSLNKKNFKKKLAQAIDGTLDQILKNVKDGYIEPAEMKLIFDMCKANGLFSDDVEERMAEALSQQNIDIEDIEVDPLWELQETPYE